MELDRHCDTRRMTFKFEKLRSTSVVEHELLINGCKTYYPNYLLWNLSPHSFLRLYFTNETVHIVPVFVISRFPNARTR
jgi:hypothetical protein